MKTPGTTVSDNVCSSTPLREHTLPPQQGLYNPRFEHDACGIGFVAHIEGRRTHKTVEMTLEALANHAHRGGVADDRKTGDGAGILTQIPYEFFHRELERVGIEPPSPSDLAVGQLFLFRQDESDRERARQIIRQVCAKRKLEVLHFRSVPVIDSATGKKLIHKNKAARHKSRLNQHIRNM